MRRTKDELRKEVEEVKKGLEECFKNTEVAGKELRSWFEVEKTRLMSKEEAEAMREQMAY